MASIFNDLRFRRTVDGALEKVKKVLDNSKDRDLRVAEDVDHEYVDKYDLVDQMTNSAVISAIMALERLGLTKEKIKMLDLTKPVTLRYESKNSVRFLHEKKVDVPISPSVETTTKTVEKQAKKDVGSDSSASRPTSGTTEKTTTSISKIVKTVTEYHNEVNMSWEVSVYSGTDLDGKIVLDSRAISFNVVLGSKNERLFLNSDPIEVSLSWFLDQIDIEKRAVKFSIDREHQETRTPRRNKFVNDAVEFFDQFKHFANDVLGRFQDSLRRLRRIHKPAQPDDLSVHLFADLEVPDSAFVHTFLPLFEQSELDHSALTQVGDDLQAYHLPRRDDSKSSLLLSNHDLSRLFTEQNQTFKDAEENFSKEFPSRSSALVTTVAEATLCYYLKYILSANGMYHKCVNYVEDMLKQQLVAAIGKEVTSDDIEQFVRFHNQKLLKKVPKSFCYAIRRPGYFPEGLLSIESTNEGKLEPIETHVREMSLTSNMKMALTAACTVELSGKAYLHGWSRHRFGHSTKSYQLIARARQFSSFVLVVGTMTASGIVPKDAIILQNKDTVNIPLILNEIPTSKEFKDAIGSLSPEQQDFAKAFRSMQLESSVLGVCVIQIKPQLEDLLGLPAGSLTKKMKLTQDLMELFLDYQVPSDLLSYDSNDEGISTNEMVAAVESHTGAVLDVIKEAKEKQLGDQIMAADMAEAQQSAQASGGLFGKPERKKASGAFKQIKTASGRQGLMRGFGGGEGNRLSIEASASSDAIDWPVSEGAAQKKATEMANALHWLKSDALAFDDEASKMANNLDLLDFLKSKPANLDFDDEVDVDMSFAEFKKIDSLMAKSGETEGSTSTQEEKANIYKTKEGDSEPGAEFTAMPRVMNATIEKYTEGCSLRSTTIKTASEWERSRQENLLTKAETKTLRTAEIKTEKERAFDLLDSLSRSGSLPIDNSELHVFVCLTHEFENDILDTIIKDNINPIVKLEMSTLLMASAIHGVPVQDLLLKDEDKKRLACEFPKLLLQD
eukprot:CAMPEP_0113458548 /NCGR_PEP_ID=MMETSP0014_2-20120614/9980_1 /TAXON_ID=2857 /ORGANISM="Nitzschia sp." /LENGTH=1010 /DNA_ID=CAMNT_0000350077 /DNA_START=318 /DNA_END=3350 /DNA_ORIENTATION=- /assembly_acc=CAM_ASM_000159